MKYLAIGGFEEIQRVENYKLNLLPSPQEMDEILGFVKIGEQLDLSFLDVAPEAQEVIVEVMIEELSTIGNVSFRTLEGTPIDLETRDFPAETSEEFYALYFHEGYLVIAAESDKGIYYGANTFLQLIKLIDGNLVIPKLEIFDYPAYEIRCITDQTSRNQIPTIENLKKVIKLLSKFKMNYHFLYFEDSFNFKKYPDLGKSRGGYTAEEIKEIQEYASRYFVELVPIFESFGHVDNILMTNYPKYAHLGEFPGAAVFDVGNPEVKLFVEDLLKELCEAFDSKYFHLGLDETFDFGKYKTKKLIETKGKGEVLLEFYNFLIKTVKKFGKNKIICYYDNILGEKKLLENLPKDLIVFYWDYILKTFFIFPKRKYKKAKKLRDNGFPVILSPTLYDYTANFPDIRRTIKNVVSMAKYGLEIEALGIATSVWGDFLNECLRETNYFGYLVTAEAAWSPLHWNTERFKENFTYCLYGIESIDLTEALEYLNTYNFYHPTYPTKFYNHIWRHPFPTPKKLKPKVKKLDRILENNEEALQLIAKVRLKAKKNTSTLDYLAYAAKLGIYLGKKYKMAQEIQQALNQKERDEHDNVELIEKVTYLKEYLEGLKEDFEALWLRAARPNGLEPILRRFNTHLFFYQQKIQEIKDGIIWNDPFLKAEFITYPKKVNPGEPIYLRKTFQITKPIKSCHIQGMCDMLMHLYFNGEKIAEIVSKMALSVEPIIQRIQMIDITDKVKKGTNVFAAECYNYLISRVAGNIYLEIEYEDGEKEVIFSNAEWRATNKAQPGWEKGDFDDSQWQNAKSLGTPPKIGGYVTKPNFKDGIKSLESYYYGMDAFIKGVKPWAPFFLINFGIKVVGLDIF